MSKKNNFSNDKIEKERESRKLLIKSYIQRLSKGESLKSVQK